MLIKISSKLNSGSNTIAPESIYLNRRAILRNLGFLGIASNFLNSSLLARENPTLVYKGNNSYFIDPERLPTEEDKVTSYNNFYEFGTTKNIKRKAEKLSTSPWRITIDGLVTNSLELDYDDLLLKVKLEERIYRLRCVEAWSILVPWIGFPLKALLKLAEPKSSAKYLVMKTFFDPEIAPIQRQSWYPWPYTEVLPLEEAYNDLSLIAVGIYGKELPNQNGAPLRLVVPWKYGFKSIKSIVSFSFESDRPKTFWEEIQPKEYGFWANVNPSVEHPRWKQSREKDIGTGRYRDTEIFNGYSEWVSHMYKDQKDNISLYR